MFFGFSKKRRKRNHLVMQPLITLLPEVGTAVPVSHGHQHQTSCSDVWTQETSGVVPMGPAPKYFEKMEYILV